MHPHFSPFLRLHRFYPLRTYASYDALRAAAAAEKSAEMSAILLVNTQHIKLNIEVSHKISIFDIGLYLFDRRTALLDG